MAGIGSLAWGDNPPRLPVHFPAIVAYDAERALQDYAGARALLEFSRKINPSSQALIVFSEEEICERAPVRNSQLTGTVDFADMDFYPINLQYIMET